MIPRLIFAEIRKRSTHKNSPPSQAFWNSSQHSQRMEAPFDNIIPGQRSHISQG
jgi:hypothetical protein